MIDQGIFSRRNTLLALLTTGCAMLWAGCGSDPLLALGVSRGELPGNSYCTAVDDWDHDWVDFEDEVLALVNAQRAAGATCGGVAMPAVEPLAMEPALRCAARNHSLDMSTRGYFDHTSPDGQGPQERMARAGYGGSSWGENIAAGQSTPGEVMNSWMNSPGHCRNIMNTGFAHLGVGYHGDHIWTQAFGR